MLDETSSLSSADAATAQHADLDAIQNVVVRKLAERARAADTVRDMSDSPHDSVYHNQG